MSGDDILDHAHQLGLIVGLGHLGDTVERQDIDVLLNSAPETFNLFALALKELQDDPNWDTEWMSWFQIAGIHGLPNLAAWNNVAGKADTAETGGGYCEHGTIKFPTWHRPYLALLEQSLYRKMLEISKRYTEASVKEDYVKAVKKFRLPFYDYHRPRNYDAKFTGIVDKNRTTSFPYDFSVPQLFTLKSIEVLKYPNNEKVSIDNPFLSFKFPEPKGTKEALSKDDWNLSGVATTGDIMKKTSRWRADVHANSIDRLNQSVNEYREDGIRLSLVLMEDGAYNRYENMATGRRPAQKPLDGTIPSGSLEAVHNAYHWHIGGDPFRETTDGHMSSVPVAAFDPIFWFHHCNIDRMFAVWQACHDDPRDSWFANKKMASDKLLPFITESVKNNDPVCWTSDTARYTTSFGYTYPDVKGLEKGHAKEVQANWKEKYEWARRLQKQEKGQTWKAPPQDMEPLDLSDASLFRKANGSLVEGFIPLRHQKTLKITAPTANLSKMVAEPLPDFDLAPSFSTEPSLAIEEETVSREWYVDMAVKKLVLNNAFSIMYFIGERDPSADSHMLDPAFAGLSTVFTAPAEACVNCAEQSADNVKVTATAPITSMLLDYVITGALPSMKAEHVEPFLIKHLKWIVVEVNGVQHDTREIAARGEFELNVTCKVAPLPGQDGAVVYEAYPQIIAKIIENASGTMDHAV